MNIEGAGLTLRIRERPAAAEQQPKRPPSSFQEFFIDQSQADALLARLHSMIDGMRPKVCALTIIAAIEAGVLRKPTYGALKSEFPEIGLRSNYDYYLSRSENYRSDIDGIKRHF
ncbi:MAG: hypothetical protein IJK51_07850 [Bacteroidaceae bacterium]|nr:hypothetical protein [Bacteroidaceae bacterium]